MRGGGQFCAYCINSSFLFVRYVKTRVFRLSSTGWAQAVEKARHCEPVRRLARQSVSKMHNLCVFMQIAVKRLRIPASTGRTPPAAARPQASVSACQWPGASPRDTGVEQGRSGGRAGGVHRVSAVRLTAAKNVGIIPLEIEQARPCGRACFRKEDTL